MHKERIVRPWVVESLRKSINEYIKQLENSKMIDNYNIFLDDVRHPDDVTWVPNLFFDAPVAIVRSFEEFKNIIKEHGIPTFVSYDHDLSVEHYGDGLNGDSIDYSQYKEKTGLDCCKFLVEECIKKSIKHPDYVVHSMNPVGRSNIISYIESYHKSLQ